MTPNERLDIDLAIKRKAVTPAIVKMLLAKIDEQEIEIARLEAELDYALNTDLGGGED